MIVGIYCPRDTVSEEFLAPQIAQTDAAAIRDFDFAVNNAKSGMLAFRPSDFSLMKVGEMDTKTGVITPCNPKTLKIGVKIENEV